MALTLDNYPDECINLVDDCAEIEFGTDSLEEEAYSATALVITAGDLSTVVADESELRIAGHTFYFKTTPDNDLNEIGTSVANVVTGLNANSFILAYFTVTSSGGVSITPKIAGMDFSVSLIGLNADITYKNFSYTPTPYKAKEAYGVFVKVVNVGTTDVIFNTAIIAEFETDYDQQDVNSASISIKKDIGPLLDGYLETVLPSIHSTPVGVIHEQQALSKKFTLWGAEMWGVPSNVFGPDYPTLGTTIHVAKGYSVRGENPTDYCSKTFYGVVPKSMSCKSILMVASYNSSGGGSDNSFNIYLRDDDSTLGSFLYTAPVNSNCYIWQLVVRIDTESYSDDIRVVRMNIRQGSNGQNVDINVLRDEYAETLIYRTSKHTFASIVVQRIRGATVGHGSEFITACRDCPASDNERRRRDAVHKPYEELEFVLFDQDKYYELEIMEFFSSPEVYWVNGNDMVFLEPVTDGTEVYAYKQNLNVKFTGKCFYK